MSSPELRDFELNRDSLRPRSTLFATFAASRSHGVTRVDLEFAEGNAESAGVTQVSGVALRFADLFVVKQGHDCSVVATVGRIRTERCAIPAALDSGQPQPPQTMLRNRGLRTERTTQAFTPEACQAG